MLVRAPAADQWIINVYRISVVSQKERVAFERTMATVTWSYVVHIMATRCPRLSRYHDIRATSCETDNNQLHRPHQDEDR
jgi:hypothetical protein